MIEGGTGYAVFQIQFRLGGGKKLNIAWVKKATITSTINAEDCDFIVCVSSLTNIGADTVRIVSNATLVEKQRIDNDYDVEIYKDISNVTTVKVTRQYSETIVIGITLV